MDEQTSARSGEGTVKQITWTEFLESYPVNSPQMVTGLYEAKPVGECFALLAPDVRLYCDHCEGKRRFAGKWTDNPRCTEQETKYGFLEYRCRDCAKQEHVFCVSCTVMLRAYLPLSLEDGESHGYGRAVKIGEYPEVYPELPRSVERLVGEDIDLLKKGCSCEKRGHGIGAFVYYRRVVEAQTKRLFDQIIRAAESLDSSAEMLADLRKAAEVQQFSRAIEGMKEGIPQSLFVDRHNPLELLHDALSIGVHTTSDEDCLSLSHTVRSVLVALAERISRTLADEREFRSAVGNLARFKAQAKAVRDGEGK